MKLYEINQEIERIMDGLIYDPETGEILQDAGDDLAKLELLQMDRDRILEYLAKCVLNTRSDMTALKEEEARLRDRRKALEHKEERLMKILDRECCGQKTDLGVATLNYRKTSHLDVSDSARAIRWLKRNKYHNCYRVPEPEVSKAEVKKLINAGIQVPGCEVVEDRSCSLK